jgi:hypothetical protein
MKIELTETPLLSPQQIGELASSLDSLHTRVLKTIDRLQKEVAAKADEVANRWKKSAISPQDRLRFAQNETAAVIVEIQRNCNAELDRFYKEAGPLHAKIAAQRPYYDSPVKVLSRAGLGTTDRTAYVQQLAYAGPGELGHMAQVAVGTKNAALAAAVLSLIDAQPTNQRPLGAATLATAMQLEAFTKVQEYFKIGQARFQGIVIALRTWKAGKSYPIDTVALGLYQRDVDFSVLAGDDE